MSLSDNDRSCLRKLVKHFKSLKPASVRLKQFFVARASYRYSRIPDRIWIKLLSCKRLFPSVSDKKKYFNIAVTKRKLNLLKLLEASGFEIHEVALRNGRSAVHHLAESLVGLKYNYSPRTRALKLVDYFLESARKNHCDEQGYTYLHAACVAGNATAARKLLRRGADVDCDSYKYSALQAAAWYKHEDVVEVLLEAGADPNRPDVEGSTPLHSLSWLCLCECESSRRYCDKRKPVERIVRMLVEAGADIEARNRHGDTALQASVSRLDVELARVLLKHGASLSSLNEDRMFAGKFKPIELKAYPLALNIIEMLQLLQSAGYEVDLLTRLKMLKCWMRVREYDDDESNEDFIANRDCTFTIRAAMWSPSSEAPAAMIFSTSRPATSSRISCTARRIAARRISCWK
ncbi:unnamed protein product [Trichogramma brassicae]|uniref:Uncharacterized protein n=1 Tax=Trichogramma brassicae TaxID=86971 RepID=A0A6H5I8Z6_9HYME|nr:unnamed protein product [Trichogramma brassicae]